jgi:hypothetical protein
MLCDAASSSMEIIPHPNALFVDNLGRKRVKFAYLLPHIEEQRVLVERKLE